MALFAAKAEVEVVPTDGHRVLPGPTMKPVVRWSAPPTLATSLAAVMKTGDEV
jgi:hypothetical protein